MIARSERSTVPVLVTGGEYRIALATTRALGRRGIPVAVMASEESAVTFSSRYCTQRIVTPPDHHKAEYQSFVADLVARRQFSGILFCDDLAAMHIGEIREALSPYVPILLPQQALLELSMNKRRMLEFAAARGIGMPTTVFPASLNDLDQVLDTFRPPVVVKGIRGDSSRHLRICGTVSKAALTSAFSEIAALERQQGISEWPLVQEYVTGDVYSAIVLCDQGRALASFAMKKIRTFPEWGGICVEGESVTDTGIKGAVSDFLSRVAWHGIVEMEFIRDRRDGQFKLVEFNPDFNWGLDFAVHAGVDFPCLAYRVMQGESLVAESEWSYEAGRRFLWFLPEGVKYLRRHPASISSFLLKALSARTGTDLQVGDITAFLRQVKHSLGQLFP